MKGDKSINGQIRLFIEGGESILVRKPVKGKSSWDDPVRAAMQQAIPPFVADIAENLLHTSKARRPAGSMMRSYLRKQELLKRKEEDRRYVLMCEQWLVKVEELLSRVSVVQRSLPSEGNSRTLLGRLAKAKDAARADTWVRRSLVLLRGLVNKPLVFNENIPLLSQDSRPDQKAYDIICNLERVLRKLVVNQLSLITANWWKERVPSDVKEKAKERMTRDGRQDIQDDDEKYLDFVDFGDFGKIIGRKNNWKDAFRSVFGDKDIIMAKLKELEPIRNHIAHSRDLSKRDIQKLHVYSDEILQLIRLARTRS